MEEFFLPERPAIFPNAVRASGSASELCRKLQSRIAADAQKTERSMWYDVREELLDEICQTPPLIDRLMNEEDAFLRDNCVRIWVSEQGNISPWHYDGHSLHVFNLQLFGRKRWTIVAPDTPLLCMPFNNVCMLNHVLAFAQATFRVHVGRRRYRIPASLLVPPRRRGDRRRTST